MTPPNRRDLGLAAAGALFAASTAAVSATRPPSAGPSAGGAAFARPTAPVPVAILLDRGATLIDFAGPWEVFQDAEEAGVPGFSLYTVAPDRSPLRVSAGLQIVPDYGLADAPQPRVIVIGAQEGKDNPAKLAWIRKAAAQADVVMSVCTGAFVLAETGLIDGLAATTHHNFYEKFEARYPAVRLQRSRRFVDNGKFISAGGLTSGIDGALHVVSRFYGEDAARQNALYMEHDSHGWLSGLRA